MRPVSVAQLRATATVDLMTAAQVLGLGRTTAYKLARRDEFPCQVVRVQGNYRVPTPGLLELLGITSDQPRPPEPGTGAPGRPPATGRRDSAVRGRA